MEVRGISSDLIVEMNFLASQVLWLKTLFLNFLCFGVFACVDLHQSGFPILEANCGVSCKELETHRLKFTGSGFQF